MKTKYLEKPMKIVFFITALTAVLAVLLICVFLFANGVPAMGKIGLFSFLGGKDWSPTDTPSSFGILPMIMGSIYTTFGAIIIGVPIGLMTAIFMARFSTKRINKFLNPVVELLAGIPSIIYGFFGLQVIVPFVRDSFGGNGNSILTASLLLGFMILPTIIAVSKASLDAVDKTYYEGALALGASHEKSVMKVVVPAAKSGIIAAVVLGIGRAIGEAMAVTMVIGNQARMPIGLLKGARTLTTNIVSEMSYAADLHREALIATGVVLLVFILIINLVLALINKKAGGR
ncbi:phosphate ABC transporter permease subunit PstC [Paludicola sp. MB14-C6]|nr:phosphate ABC transporter permease subunit PstC [Paludicola sp. MB14-C6]WMJ24422.1 phosphate ABC transporter permease subunit PstC [Paludicola sp. MB14-C6]